MRRAGAALVLALGVASARGAHAAPTGATTPAPAPTRAPASPPPPKAPAPKPAAAPAKKPAPAPAKAHAPPAPAKPARGAPAKPPKPGARDAKRPAPEPDPNRPADTPELAELRGAEREIFAPPAPRAQPAWSSEGAPPLVVDPARPVVHTSGVAPQPPLGDAPPAEPPTRDLSWLRALTLPDLPVRWDERVVRYLEFYRDDPRGRSLVAAWLRKSGRYEAPMRRALRSQGLPEDLVWVALVESGFEPTARSPAGAVGLWQLMPEGARAYGLEVDRWADERLDPERSTEAAARYLADLHRRFGAWELALAGYNMGHGGLLAAIRKFNTNDFWELSRLEAGIPWETTLYVPKIVAMAVVARNPSAFGVESSERDAAPALDVVLVPGGVPLRVLASAAGMSLAALEAQNPQFRAGRTPPDAPESDGTTRYRVRVPVGKGALVELAASGFVGKNDGLDRHVVRSGETAETIAAAHRLPRAKLGELNALRADESLRAGTVLLVPRGEGSAAPNVEKPVVVVTASSASQPGKRRVFFRPLTGETLADVAAALGVPVDELRRSNALDPGARLHEGMTIAAWVDPAADLSKIPHFEEGDVRVLLAGTEDFYTYFEGLRGRRRAVVVVQKGDSFDSIARRHGLTVGQLERINRRSRTTPLAAGDELTVYAPVGAAVVHEAQAKQGPADGLTPLAPLAQPTDLPAAGEPIDDELGPAVTK